MDCPVCDFEVCDIRTLIERVESRDLLITLACDVAERIVCLTSCPARARKWLVAVRAWQDSPKAASRANTSALNAVNVLKKETPATSALRAVWAATWAAEAGGALSLTKSIVSSTTTFAAGACEDPYSENEWQLHHAHQLFCTCPPAFKADQMGPRGRRSLLAQ
jgi:hypothetical protein